MKTLYQILVIAVLFIGFGNLAYGQGIATPRYGTAANQDNTGRVMTWGKITKGDTLGVATDTVITTLMDGSGRSFYHTDVTFNLLDSTVFAFKSSASSHYGDELNVMIYNSAGSNHYVNFLGYSGLTSQWGMATTGTKISPATGGWAFLRFWYDGILWREASRQVH